MAYILLSISRFWLLLMGLCCAYQLGYTLLSLVKTPRWKPGAGTNRYAVLICARNEAAVLPKLLESLRAQDYPGVLDLYVAADNCTDDTARLARKGGATVFERHDLVHVGKGYALNFLLHRIWAEGKHYDGYLLFDADNLARPDFVRRLDGVFGPECPVVAGYRNTKNYRGWVAAGQGLCFIREVRFLNCPRTLLGFSGNVTGTGFLVSEEILRTAGGWPWHCLCEDLEFSTVQMIAGRRIAYCPQAEYFDEQPATLSQSVRQRLRWCKGFLQVMASRGAGLGRAALRGSWSCADLLISRIAPVLFNLLALGFATVGAALAGAVYGDHISPISDTTILSSAGAKCNHLRHVATQIPYATLVMIVCFVGYIIAGFTKNPWISLALGVVLIVIAVLVLVRMEASKKAKA